MVTTLSQARLNIFVSGVYQIESLFQKQNFVGIVNNTKNVYHNKYMYGVIFARLMYIESINQGIVKHIPRNWI